MSKRLQSYWRCGFPKCSIRSVWKLNISDNSFLTVCDDHVTLYIRIYPWKVERLTSTQGLPVGWDFIKQKNITVGAIRKGMKGRYGYASRSK